MGEWGWARRWLQQARHTGVVSLCAPLTLSSLSPSPLLSPQINDKFSSTAAHFMTFEEVLDKFEEDRLMLQREEEDKEMA